MGGAQGGGHYINPARKPSPQITLYHEAVSETMTFHQRIPTGTFGMSRSL